jgi:hypothetical protein
MPPRTNAFQRLIYLVKASLSPEAVVTESKMLLNRRTGSRREVDVCIEGKLGDSEVTVCVECTDKSRPADVQWIEANKTKHENLPTNLLILASRSGFTSDAVALAKAYGIKTVTLSEIDDTDIADVLNNKSTLWRKQWKIFPRRIDVSVYATASHALETFRAPPDLGLYHGDGTLHGALSESIMTFLSRADLQAELGRQVSSEHRWIEWAITARNRRAPCEEDRPRLPSCH